MGKTELMEEYEARTGLKSTRLVGSHWCNEEAHTEWYVDDLEERLIEAEAKAAAYDRLMSGGKKTLNEWANLLGKPIAVDVEGRLLWFPKKPEIGLVTWILYDEQFGCFGEELPKNLIDFNGDWKDSLTLPDRWEEK